MLLKLPVKLGQEQKQGKSPEWSHNQSRNSIFIIWDDFARQGTGRGSSLDLHVVLTHPGKPHNKRHPCWLQSLWMWISQQDKISV